MTKRLKIYKCNACGNIVEVLHSGAGTLVCCGAPMQELEEQTADATTEKHVPVIEKIAGGIKVKVGSVPHPMKAEHYIEWIEIITGPKVCQQFLKPGDQPEVAFNVGDEPVGAREYCNVHGLWKV